jgi:hypothetical protein
MGGNFENHPGNKTRHADVLNCGVPVLNIIWNRFPIWLV